jgi:NAD(P)H-nitrite reductase large subunit
MAEKDITRYVIIGGSAAGMSAAQAIRKTDPRGAVTVLSAETDAPYFRPLIPYLISGKKSAAEMMMAGRGPYVGENITVWTGAPVTAIDVKEKNVSIAEGERIYFDRLLIATGASPVIPPEIKGTDAAGVFALRTLAQAKAAAKRVEKARRAVLLGGGLLNLKAAFSLLERGIEVTLVVFSPEVLSQLMEPADAARLRGALIAAGLNIMTGTAATAVCSGPGGVTGVLLDNGRSLACEMVFIGKGVVPNTALLRGSGIELEEGVIAGDDTATSAAGVFTAGDVAMTYDPVLEKRIHTGLWTNAVEMGRCAGFNMAGKPTAYTGTLGIMNATQIGNEPFVSMGIVHTTNTDYETHISSGSGFYRKIVFSPDGRRLAGAVLSGDISGAGLLRAVMRERRPVDAFKSAIISGRLHYGHFLS